MNKVQRAVLMAIFFTNLPISVSHIEQLLGKCVSQKKIKEVPPNPAGYVGYLIIVGLGLGLHLEKIVLDLITVS